MVAGILEQAALPGWGRPLSVRQYQYLSWNGILPEDSELIRGHVIETRSKSPGHRFAVEILFSFLTGVFTGSSFYVTIEQPLTLVDSEPEPDLSVIGGRPADYRKKHPETARLAVEVAVSSLAVDREKAAVYAEAAVTEYWLVDIPGRRVEVFREPAPDGYRERRMFTPGESIELEGHGLDPADLF